MNHKLAKRPTYGSRQATANVPKETFSASRYPQLWTSRTIDLALSAALFVERNPAAGSTASKTTQSYGNDTCSADQHSRQANAQSFESLTIDTIEAHNCTKY